MRTQNKSVLYIIYLNRYENKLHGIINNDYGKIQRPCPARLKVDIPVLGVVTNYSTIVVAHGQLQILYRTDERI